MTALAKDSFNTVRADIRALVDQAQRAKRPITSQIIWGLLSREIPEDSFTALLSSMCGSHQLTKVEPPAALEPKRGAKAWCYEPGPVDVVDGRRRERVSMSMGNMAHRRFVEAKAAARRWANG
jgi:hypothetical protein